MRRRRPLSAVALLATPLLLAAACSDPGPADGPSGPPFLLERLDAARLYATGADAPEPPGRIETGSDGSVRLSLPLRGDWERLPPPRARALGLRDERLTAWFLEAELPTADAEGVAFRAGGRDLSPWRRPLPPEPFSGFYQPGGFVRRGVYWALPAGVRPGELAPRARFRPGPTALVEHRIAAGEPFPPDALHAYARGGAVTRPSLLLPAGLAVGFPTSVPPDGRLRFALLRRPRLPAARDEPAARLRVGFREAFDRPWQLRETLDFPAEPEAWRTLDLDLAPAAGRTGELVFELLDDRPGRSFHFVGDPAIAPGPAPARPSLVLVVVDGLRADRLGREDLTPQLSALAAAGLSFSAARAAAPWTRPSIASLFTGRMPAAHGVEREQNGDVLRAGIPTLAEALRRAGYATAAVSANLHLDPAFGLHRGFGFHHTRLADGRHLNEVALDWLDGRPADPFFLFLFYMDTHYPFRHRPAWDRSSALEAEVPSKAQMASAELRRRGGVPEPTPDQLRKLEALYDENVRYADERIRELLAGLRRRGVASRTVVVVTADHGEAFGEHGDLFHGWNLHDELLRVPLVAAGDLLPGRGERVAPVSLVDLPASLLALLGVDAGGLSGRSDLLVGAGPLPAAPVHAESRFRGTGSVAIVDRGHKLILDREGGTRLFDLARDPGERRDLAAERPRLARELEAALRARLERDARLRAEVVGAAPAPALAPETEAQLRALGYLPEPEDGP